MATTLASGNWIVREGSQATFVSRRSVFLESTASTVPEFRWAILLADGENPRSPSGTAWPAARRGVPSRAFPTCSGRAASCARSSVALTTRWWQRCDLPRRVSASMAARPHFHPHGRGCA
jgi:hypothetical protein